MYKRQALFCVIPDSDKSYNFIIGMLYTQIFQELYYQADFNCGGRLPIHVTFMLDEFANVALPDDFCSLLSTMRSRDVYKRQVLYGYFDFIEGYMGREIKGNDMNFSIMSSGIFDM